MRYMYATMRIKWSISEHTAFVGMNIDQADLFGVDELSLIKQKRLLISEIKIYHAIRKIS